ncbi:hypothetical protein YC2023_059263 [Brassica napus]
MSEENDDGGHIFMMILWVELRLSRSVSSPLNRHMKHRFNGIGDLLNSLDPFQSRLHIQCIYSRQ